MQNYSSRGNDLKAKNIYLDKLDKLRTAFLIKKEQKEKITIVCCTMNFGQIVTICIFMIDLAGFRSRSREPAIKIDGSETLRHPLDILLLELMKAYIF